MKPYSLVIAFVSTLALAQAARVAIPAGPPPGRQLIWVLQADNRLAAYDATDFHLWQTLALPPEAKGHPENISISRQGAVLVTYPAGENLSRRRVWQSDPRLAVLSAGTDDEKPASGGGALVTSAIPEVYFTSDPDRLLWFTNRKQIQRSAEGPEASVATTFQAWTTTRQGGDMKQVLDVALPKCACETGACEESCPEVRVWAPETGISDFFFTTTWVPGQIQSTFQSTQLYRLQNGRWTAQALPAAVESFADMADHGNTYVEIVSDAACCGWENESDDTTYLARNGRLTTIYDERQRYHNDNYDVSFFTTRVRVAPDGTRVAYTIASTHKPGDEIRLGDSGKENPEELKRVQKVVADLPRVEVLAPAGPTRIVFSQPGELADWLDNTRLVAVQSGEVIVIDVASGTRTPTHIKTANAQNVFVR